MGDVNSTASALRAASTISTAWGSLMLEAAAEIDRLHAEVAEHETRFERMYAANMRGIKAWQEATGRDMVWPDHAKLVEWLCSEVAELRADLKDSREMAHSWFYKSQTAQTPRPMGEAPRDGTWVLVWAASQWNILKYRHDAWEDEDGAIWMPGAASRWLPLPPAPATGRSGYATSENDAFDANIKEPRRKRRA
jgi:hypothetical protein